MRVDARRRPQVKAERPRLTSRRNARQRSAGCRPFRTGRAGIRLKLVGLRPGQRLTLLATAVIRLLQHPGRSLRQVEPDSLPGMSHAFVIARQVAELSSYLPPLRPQRAPPIWTRPYRSSQERQAITVSLDKLAATAVGRGTVDTRDRRVDQLSGSVGRLRRRRRKVRDRRQRTHSWPVHSPPITISPKRSARSSTTPISILRSACNRRATARTARRTRRSWSASPTRTWWCSKGSPSCGSRATCCSAS